jgi:hypothetical protein
MQQLDRRYPGGYHYQPATGPRVPAPHCEECRPPLASPLSPRFVAAAYPRSPINAVAAHHTRCEGDPASGRETEAQEGWLGLMFTGLVGWENCDL